MGIKGLPKLISDIAGSAAVRTYKFSKFKNWTVSVDASLIIHQTVIALRSSGRDMKNSKGELTSHLHGLFYKILGFLQNGMVPIFVFDGKAPDLKNKTIEKRKLRKELAEQSLQELTDSEDENYIKKFKQTFKPTRENIKEAQILLDLMGIPYIVAPGEADVVCAWLAARHDSNGKRYTKGVCSDDSDMLALGAPYLFKDMLRFMSKNKPVKVISLNKALVKMNLTMDQFIDMCVLLGTDYCDSIKGIGPKSAYKLIVKHGSLEKVLKYLHKDDINSDGECVDGECLTNEKCMIDARNYFKNALVEIDESDDFVITDDQIKLRQYQYEELIDFMCVKHGFDFTRIQTGIERLKEYYQQMNVTRENTKKYHKIIQPRSENYIFQALTEEIEFLPSESESEKEDSIDKEESEDSASDEKMPSKKSIKMESLKKNKKKISIRMRNKTKYVHESSENDSESDEQIIKKKAKTTSKSST